MQYGRWDRAVLGVEVVNLLVCGKVRIGNNSRLCVETPQDCHSDVLLCAFADEGAKESSIWYCKGIFLMGSNQTVRHTFQMYALCSLTRS